MIDINKLRRLAQAANAAPDGVSLNWVKLLQDFQKEANPAAVSELLDRIEAAESDAIEQARLNGIGASREAALMAKLETAEKERTIDEQRIADLMEELNRVGQENEELRARIEAMEKQEPIGWLLDGDFYEVRQMSLYKDNDPLPGQTALYALPGAQVVGSSDDLYIALLAAAPEPKP